MLECRSIHITGIVQGVGFRPFVYQLAIKNRLCGWVRNDAEGVYIKVEGSKATLDVFVEQLSRQAPVLSNIEQLNIVQTTPSYQLGFKIINSSNDKQVNVGVPPDQAICHQCRDELFDKTSRYYRYPFINCTHCGPRFSIIRQLPYDRNQTSMKEFILCQSCSEDYHNPLNRRYHAEPISCERCGPYVSWCDVQGSILLTRDAAIEHAAEKIANGGVIAVKGLGGFHLVCDASQSTVVQYLRDIKHRQSKPFAVMAKDVSVARSYVYGEVLEWRALSSQVSPIVLMRKLEEEDSLVKQIAPDSPYLGVMLPYTPLHLLLFDALDRHIDGLCPMLVMTSANLSGLPLAINKDSVLQQFGSGIDGILDHNRDIIHPCDDSIVQLAAGKIRTLRLGRGCAPFRQQMTRCVPTLMAVGAQQKSSVAYSNNNYWMLSPYIGDIDTMDTQHRFECMTDYFSNLYQNKPQRLVCDNHPGYYSTAYAKRQESNPMTVQHHYAHILSVMAEHRLLSNVIGFAFDGTGLGDDNCIWGGEVLLVNHHEYQRDAFFRPFRLIGGEQAIHEPDRILFALLLECYSLMDIKALNLSAFNSWSETRFYNLYQLWKSASNSPLCSSVGRLFDAWASLLNLVGHIEYEGQSGLIIEYYASMTSRCTSPFSFQWNEQSHQIDWKDALIQSIESRVLLGDSWVTFCCQAFISALANSVILMARHHPDRVVVVSGGVFQNRLLLEQVASGLSEYHQPFFSGEKIPVNDGGIAAGQLWYAMHNLMLFPSEK